MDKTVKLTNYRSIDLTNVNDYKIDQHSPEVLWFKILRQEWIASFWKGSALSEFAERLGLAIVPISVMPFRDGGILAKYIDYDYDTPDLMTCACTSENAPGYTDAPIEQYLLHLVSETEALTAFSNSLCSHVSPAPGLWSSVLATNPTVWFPYADESKGVSGHFAQLERKHFNKALGQLNSNGTTEEKSGQEGQFMLPLFFGTIPVFVLVVLSQRIDPKFFSRRFLESVFDSITEIGELILEEHFEDIWRKYSVELLKGANYRGNAASFLKEIWGKATNRKYFSWIHTLPGHSLTHGNRGKLVDQFANSYITQNARFWLRSHTDMLLHFQENARKNEAFPESEHDYSRDIASSLRTRIRKSDWYRVLWVKDAVDSWPEEGPSKLEFDKLKSVLVLYGRSNQNRISPALFEAWGNICKEYQGISVDISGDTCARVQIGTIDPYQLVDNIFSLLNEIRKSDADGITRTITIKQSNTDGISGTVVRLVGLPCQIKSGVGTCHDAYNRMITSLQNIDCSISDDTLFETVITF